jgi:uncharacterized protein YjbI with pentapeptide repeats
MSDPVTVLLMGGRGPLADEVRQRLEADGALCDDLSPRAAPAEKLAKLGACQVFVALTPGAPEEFQTISLAVGRGVRTVVLAQHEGGLLPRAVEVALSLTALHWSVFGQPASAVREHPIDEPFLLRLDHCREGIDWFLGRYPDGLNSSRWTPAEQIAAFRDGGAPWLKMAFRDGIVPKHPMTKAGFKGADLTALKLEKTALDGADLSDAVIGKGELVDVDLTGARLAGADLTGCVLCRCDLDEADLGGAKVANLRMKAGSARRARFDGAEGAGAFFHQPVLEGARFSGAALAGSSWNGCALAGADFTDADLREANFLHCDLRGATFEGARLAGASFIRCKVDSAVRDRLAPLAYLNQTEVAA